MTAHDTADDTGVASLAEGLRALPAAERTARTTLLVRGVVGEVAGVAADQVDPSEPFRSIGLNSIMGLELRARLERLFGLTLSSTVVWNYPTADTLAGELAVRLGEHAEAPGPEQPQQVAAPRSVRADIVAADPQGETGDLAVLQQELAELEALMGEL